MDSCVVCITVCCFLSHVNVFLIYLFHYVFFHVWNKCITIWNSYMLCFVCIFRYPVKLSSKVDTEFIFQCSVLMVCSCSSFPPDNYNLTVAEWLSFLCVEIIKLMELEYIVHQKGSHIKLILPQVQSFLCCSYAGGKMVVYDICPIEHSPLHGYMVH